jgi:hypothetical protein
MNFRTRLAGWWRRRRPSTPNSKSDPNAAEQSSRDRADIRYALEGHVHSLDSRRFDLMFTRTYTEDVLQFIGESAEPRQGSAAALQSLQGFAAMSTTSTHVLANADIELDEDRAHSVSFGVAFVVVASEEGSEEGDGRLLIRGIRYEHNWVRTETGWRCHEMRHLPIWQAELPAVTPSLPKPAEPMR